MTNLLVLNAHCGASLQLNTPRAKLKHEFGDIFPPLPPFHSPLHPLKEVDTISFLAAEMKLSFLKQ